MDLKEIRNIAKLMREMDLSSFEICEDGNKIKLERSGGRALSEALPSTPQKERAQPHATPTEGLITVTSPMLGVFYAACAPDAKPFVSIGDSIKKGDVLCIIEAMKLMNEITAEQEGVLCEICVGNGQVVDFGHPLFRLK